MIRVHITSKNSNTDMTQSFDDEAHAARVFAKINKSNAAHYERYCKENAHFASMYPEKTLRVLHPDYVLEVLNDDTTELSDDI